MKQELIQCAQALPLPALLLEGDTVAFMNLPAQKLLGAHVLGMTAQAVFGVELATEACFLWKSAEGCFEVSVRVVDESATPVARLTCLTAVASEGLPPALMALPALGRTLRGTLSLAFAALPPLMDSIDPEDEALCRQAARLHQSIVALSRLAGNVVDVPQFLKGEMLMSYEDVDLVSLIRDLLRETGPWLESRRLDCAFEYTEERIACVGDRGKLERMLLNLLSNAIKYSPAGGEILIRLRRSGDKATLLVHNTGQLDGDLADVYTRYSAERPHPAGAGFGLGLLIANAVAEKHGGQLLLSPSETGVEVLVSLPLRRTDGTRQLKSPVMLIERNLGYTATEIELSDAVAGAHVSFMPKKART